MLIGGAILFLTQTAITTPNPYGQTIKETDPIDLMGDFKTGGLRSGGDALSAQLTDGIILVTFHKNVGVVSVIITDEPGNAVYSGAADSTAGQTLISVSQLPHGAYTITFSNGKGVMYGDFEI